MSDRLDSLLDAAAEAIVFAHEPEAQLLAPVVGDLPVSEFTALERTAALAAAALALQPGPDAAAPATLRQRLAATALGYCADQRRRVATHPPGLTTTLPRRRTLGLVTAFTLGAAAAGLCLWLGILRPQTATMQRQVVSLRDLRAQVLASEPDAVRTDWKPGPSPMTGNVVGDVVWSPTRQDGWLTFRGLPKLDSDHAYQLWIVDRRREGAPVDGGLFTIDDPSADTLVPIHANLSIDNPTAFLISVEDKAGVVVSKRDHIVAIADL